MRSQRPIEDRARQRLSQLLKEVRSKSDFQRVQCLWLRAALGLNHRQVARAVGWSESRVKRLWSDYFRHGEQGLLGAGRGGRRHQNLTLSEEKQLLEGYVSQAEQGEILVVSRFQKAYEGRLGRPVPKSTVYRMLARHGWRKLMPQRRYPKNDPEQAEAFKKNSA